MGNLIDLNHVQKRIKPGCNQEGTTGCPSRLGLTVTRLDGGHTHPSVVSMVSIVCSAETAGWEALIVPNLSSTYAIFNHNLIMRRQFNCNIVKGVTLKCTLRCQTLFPLAKTCNKFILDSKTKRRRGCHLCRQKCFLG